MANFDFGKYYGIGADGSGGDWYSCTLYGTEDSLPGATFVDANGLSGHYQFTLLGFSEDFSFFRFRTAQP